LATRYDPRMHAYDEQGRSSGMIYVLMLVVALAFGGFVWQLYSAPETPRIAAQPGPYKSAPAAESQADAAELQAYEAASGEIEVAPEVIREPVATTEQPQVAARGPYVAQLAALQSAAAADVAWRRFASRAPSLFAAVHLDVERADLGQRGIYYRVRAGYFAERGDASRFCDEIKQMGQDCIATAR
jgi:SPOR domain